MVTVKQVNLEGYELFFVGDKCEPGGNDHEIFDYVRIKNEDNALETPGPEETLQYYDTLLKR